MTILTMNRKELEKRIGKITPEVEEKITQMGTPLELITQDEVSIEIFPNRPDLLSLGNFARAFNLFRGKINMSDIKVTASKEKLTVSKNVPKEWPFAVACIVKGITMTDERIKEIIDIQEKLHSSLLRKRKKGGMGVYPLDKVSFPIRVEGRKREEISFRPLESSKEMNAKQIFKEHPTGIEYAPICETWEKLPVFIDANKNILSMPPIINSHDTGKVDISTKDLFVETTGNNLSAVLNAFHILISALYEMGGSIYSVECIQKDGKKIIAPNFSREKKEFSIEDINKTLGITLPEKTFKTYFARMDIGYESKKGKNIAYIPAYRSDILHWIDLAEEIAIAHGYENFDPEMPRIATIGEENSRYREQRVLTEVLIGLGLLEVSSYHLTTKKNIKRMHFDYKDFLELEESKTERDVLRIDLVSNLLQIFSENSDSAYPQKIFEIGRVFARDTAFQTGIRESDHLAVALIDEEIGFTDIKQILEYLFKMIHKTFELEEVDDSNFIPGRVGIIKVQGKEIGRIGEIAPRVIKNWKIKAPVAAFELDVEELFS